jgi:hypothetical protein
MEAPLLKAPYMTLTKTTRNLQKVVAKEVTTILSKAKALKLKRGKQQVRLASYPSTLVRVHKVSRLLLLLFLSFFSSTRIKIPGSEKLALSNVIDNLLPSITGLKQKESIQ